MNLHEAREEIEKIDHSIINLLAKRFSIVKKVALLKKQNNMPIRDSKREKDKIRRFQLQFRGMGWFDDRFIKKLYNVIFRESRKIQKEYIRKNAK